MKKRRKRLGVIDILKVVVCILLVVLVGYGAKIYVQNQNSKPAANVQNGTSNTNTVKPEGTVNPEVNSNPTLNKTTAEIYVSNTFELKVEGASDSVTYSSSDEQVASVSPEGIVKGVEKGSATITALVGGTSLTCDVTVKKSKLVALTFDDGPCIYTPIVLDALEKYHAKATFFIVGNRINSTTAEYMKRADSLGCEYGNHSFTHPEHFEKLPVEKMKDEINKANAAIEKVTGKKPALLRVPGGWRNETVNSVAELPQILWTVDTEDWKKKNRNSDYITKYVLDHAYDGSVILMHDIHPTSAKAVEGIVKGLQDQGFELVTVSELAAAKNVELEGHKVYISIKNK